MTRVCEQLDNIILNIVNRSLFKHTHTHTHTHIYIYIYIYIYISEYFIYQLIHNRVAFKRILKFTLKQLLHVSVQSSSSGSVLFELAKVIVIKINKYIYMYNI